MTTVNTDNGKIPVATGISILLLIVIGAQFATITILYFLFDSTREDLNREQEKQAVDNEKDNRLQQKISGNQKYISDLAVNVTEQNKKIIENSDRNFQAVINASMRGEADRARAGNSTLALFLPLILDTDEDIEQIKRVLNITREEPADRIRIDFNGTHVRIENANKTSIFRIPTFGTE